MENHWWQVVLLPTARGLVAPAMPAGARTLDVEFDFIDHRLVARTSDGARRELPLEARPVAEFYRDYRGLLADLGIEARFVARPNEVVESIPFAEDTKHAAYDPDAAQRCWRVIASVRSRDARLPLAFVGKCSPVHFWWGAFDLACTRFSGRPAPPHPGGFRTCRTASRAKPTRTSASARAGGRARSADRSPSPRSTLTPIPSRSAVRRGDPPARGKLSSDLREWVLPYEAVRAASDPDAMLLEFLQSTYEVRRRPGRLGPPRARARGT
jgi:hypothetical protein